MKNKIYKIAYILTLSVSATVSQAQLYWDTVNTIPGPQGGSGMWTNTVTTWWDGSGNVTWTAGNVAVFGGSWLSTFSPQVDLRAKTQSVSGLQFDALLPNYRYYLTNGIIQMSSGIIANNDATINTRLALTTAATTWTLGNGSVLTVLQPITNLTAGAELTLTGNGVVQFNASDSIINRLVVGPGVIAQPGANNTFTNAGGRTTITVQSGGAFDINARTTTDARQHNFDIAGTGTTNQGALYISTGAPNDGYRVMGLTLTDDATVNTPAGTRFDIGVGAGYVGTTTANITNLANYTLTKIGGGTLPIRVTNIYNLAGGGAIKINEGTLYYEGAQRNEVSTESTTNYVAAGARVGMYLGGSGTGLIISNNMPVVLNGGSLVGIGANNTMGKWFGSVTVNSNSEINPGGAGTGNQSIFLSSNVLGTAGLRVAGGSISNWVNFAGLMNLPAFTNLALGAVLLQGTNTDPANMGIWVTNIILHNGPGLLVLGTNIHAGQIVVNNDAPVQFDSPTSLVGPATAVTYGTNMVVPVFAAGYALDDTLFNYFPSANATGVVALAVDSANALDFSTHPNMTLGGMPLGSMGTVPIFSGTITPASGIVNLGGGDNLVVSNFSSTDKVIVGGIVADGTITLAGSNYFSQPVVVAGGYLRPAPGNTATVNGANVLVFTNSGTMDFGSGLAFLNNYPTNNNFLSLHISGAGMNGNGVIIGAPPHGNPMSITNITLFGDSVINMSGGDFGHQWGTDSNLFSSIEGNGYSLVKNGTGVLDLRMQKISNLPLLQINGGNVYFENHDPDMAGTTVLVNNGAAFSGFSSGSNRTINAGNIILNGGTLQNYGGGANATTGGTVTYTGNVEVRTNSSIINGNAYAWVNDHIHLGNFSGEGQLTVNTTNRVVFGGNLSLPGGVVNLGAGTLTFSNTPTSPLFQMSKTDNSKIQLLGNSALPALANITRGSIEIAAGSIPTNRQIELNSGVSAIAMGAPMTQSFLDGVTTNSSGSVLITAPTSANLDFSALPGVALGSVGSNAYTGAITPANNMYRLGGPGNDLLSLQGVNKLTGNNNVWVQPSGIVQIDSANTLNGWVTNYGGLLEFWGGNDTLSPSLIGPPLITVVSDVNATNYFTDALAGYPYGTLNGGILGLKGMARYTDGSEATLTNVVVLAGGSLVQQASTAVLSNMNVVDVVVATNGYNTIASAPGNDFANVAVLQITNLVRPAGATVQFRSQYGTLGSVTNASGNIYVSKVNGANLGNGFVGGWALASSDVGTNLSASRDFATNTPTGIQVLGNYNTFAAGTNVHNVLANNATLTSQSAVGFSKTFNSLTVERPIIITNRQAITINSGGLVMRGNDTYIGNGTGTPAAAYFGRLVSALAGGELFIHTPDPLDQAGGKQTIHAVTTNNGGTTMQIVKDGPGSLTLSNRQFLGSTRVLGGRVVAAHTNALGLNIPVTIYNGGQAFLSAAGPYGNPITLSGQGCVENAGILGALRLANSANPVGAITLAGDSRLTVYGAAEVGAISGIISGPFGIEKTGAGILQLKGRNTFTGNIFVNEGILCAGSNNFNAFGPAAGSNSMVFVNPGGTIDFANSTNPSGAGFNHSLFVLNGGTLSNSIGGAAARMVDRLLVTAPSTIRGAQRWDVRGPNGIPTNDVWVTIRPGVVLNKVDGNGIYFTSGCNVTNDGVINIMQGTLGIEQGTRLYGSGRWTLNGATLTLYSTSDPVDFNQPLTVWAPSTISSGNGVNYVSSTITLSNRLTLAPNAAVTNLVISGPIIGRSEVVVNAAQSFQNLITFTGTNTFDGTLIFNSGNLVLKDNGSFANATNIWINLGAVFDVDSRTDHQLTLNGSINQKLMGLGTVKGSVVAPAGSSLVPATNNLAGVLTIYRNLSIDGTTNYFDLSPDATGLYLTNDMVIANGNFTATGGNRIIVNAFNGGLAEGTYTLIRCDGIMSATAGNFVVEVVGLDPSVRGMPVVSIQVVGKEVQLVVTGGSAALVWQGDGSGNWWDVNTTANWMKGVTPAVFFTSDAVLFNDSTLNNMVNLGVGVSPSSVIVSNNSASYLFTGPGSISGSNTLTKLGSGELVLNLTNNYSGMTFIRGGTLSVPYMANAFVPSPIGLSNLLVDGGTLKYTGLGDTFNRTLSLYGSGAIISVTNIAAVLTNTGAMQGNGTLVKTGPGMYLITADNNNRFMGDTLISQGLLRLNNNNSLGSATSPGKVTINDANTGTNDTGLLLESTTGTWNYPLPIIVNNLGSGKVSIGVSNSAANTTVASFLASSTLSLNRATTLLGGTANRTHFDGVISGNVSTLTIAGGQRVTFGNTNTFVGDVDIQGTNTALQTLRGNSINSYPGNTIPDASSVNVGDGAYFQLASDEAINGLTGTGTVRTSPGGRTAELTIGAGNGSSTFAGSMINYDALLLNLVKEGSGTITLTGTNLGYTGGTSVRAGTLALGINVLAIGSPNLYVASNATLSVASPLFARLSGQDISGFGTLGGSYSNAPGSSLTPGINNVAGTLSFTNNLTLTNTTINVDLANVTTVGAGVNDLITVAGVLSLKGTITLNLSALSGALATGSYEIVSDPNGIDYSDFTTFVLTGLNTNTHYTITADKDTDSTKIFISVQDGPGATLTWVGGDNTTNIIWNRMGNTNWLDNTTALAQFWDLDAVLFDNTVATTNIFLTNNPALMPGRVTVNSTNN